MTRELYLQKLLQNIKRNPAKSEQTATASKYPQGYFKVKNCKHCGTPFKPKAPSEHYCSDLCKDYSILNNYYKRVYNITLEDYLDMAEQQNFVCVICHKDNFAMGKQHSGALVVDHCHTTNKVRGLLCHNCNRALGLLQDDKEVLMSAITYLERVTTIPKGSTLKRVEAVSIDDIV